MSTLVKQAGRRRRRAFSLIEFTAVLALMALLATVVTLNVRRVTIHGKQNAARTEIGTLREAVESFYGENNRYPTNDEGLAVLTRPGKGGEPLIKQLPPDPWDHPYQYLCPGRSDAFEIVSYGADGRPGGTGADLDLSSADARTSGH